MPGSLLPADSCTALATAAGLSGRVYRVAEDPATPETNGET